MFWCSVLSSPVKLLLPGEDQEDKNGDAGGQDDFSFCVELSLTVLAATPAHHHLVSLVLAQETPIGKETMVQYRVSLYKSKIGDCKIVRL